MAGKKCALDGFVDRQYAALLMQQRELERRIGIIGNTRKLLEQIRKNDTGKPELYEQPEIFRLKVTKVLSDPATSFSEISTDIHRHLKECAHPGIQAFPMGASIGREDFQKEQYVYREVFSFADAQASGPGIRELSGRLTVVDGLPGERRRYPDRLPENPKLSERAAHCSLVRIFTASVL